MKIITTLAFLLFSPISLAMVEMKDDQLADVTGQALMQMDKEFSNGFTFYTAGLDAVLELNLNIEKLQLGCGGVNQKPGCDLDIDQFSLGCIADANGACISLNPASGSNQLPGALGDCGNNSCAQGDSVDVSLQNQIKDFVLHRPYFQFAIKNDHSATLREVVGVRLGAEKSQGPLSFGALNFFSGYMNGTARFGLLGETDVAATQQCTPANSGNCSKYQDASAFLGLNNAQIKLGATTDCDGWFAVGAGACTEYNRVTVNYGDKFTDILDVGLAGNRETQAGISGINLGTLINQVVDSLSLNRAEARICVLACGGYTNLTNWDQGTKDLLLDFLRPNIKSYVRNQVASGLGLPNGNTATLDAYVMPYNLDNVHQLDVNSSLFGLSFQKEAVQYPGYENAVLTGWAMYAPDAFFIDASNKLSVFMNNLAGGAAANGDITGLAPSYRNCWGSARFC